MNDEYDYQVDVYNELKKVFDKHISFHILSFNCQLNCNCKFNLHSFLYQEFCNKCQCCHECCECFMCDHCDNYHQNCYYITMDSGDSFNICEKCLPKRYRLVEFYHDEYTLLERYTNKTIIEKVDNSDIMYFYSNHFMRNFNNLLKCVDFDMKIKYYDEN